MEEISDDVSHVIPRQVLSCEICDEDCHEAKLLPCLHTFCQKCLVDEVAKIKTEESKLKAKLKVQPEQTMKTVEMVCPKCGFVVGKIDEVNVDELMDNCLVNRLGSNETEICEDREEIVEENVRCEEATCENKSVKRCVNCDVSLCGFCSLVHNDNTETSSHRIEMINVVTENNNDILDNEINETIEKGETRHLAIAACCDKYDAFEVSAIFCVDCDMGLCVKCHKREHVKHRCTELTAVAENFEIKIEDPLAELDGINQGLNRSVNIMNDSLVTLEKRRKDVTDSIGKRRELLVKLIHEYETTLLSEVQRRFDHNRKRLTKKMKNTQNHSSGVDAALKLADNLLAYGNDEEKVALRKPIGRRVRDLCEQTQIDNIIVPPISIKLLEPTVTVDVIGNIFGELGNTNGNSTNGSQAESLDSADRNELSDVDMDLGASGSSDTLRELKMKQEQNNVKFHDVVEHIPYAPSDHELDAPIHKFQLPNDIRKDCIKGIGVNENGDVVVAISQGSYQSVSLIERRGIIRGKIHVDKGWNIHTVTADGRIAEVMSRGDNRFRVRVVKGNNNGCLVNDTHIESYGPSNITANNSGQIIVTATRYPQVCGKLGKAGKLGANISIHDKDGYVVKRLTNETFKELGLHVFERPSSIAVDKDNNFVITDSGNHKITAFDMYGDLLFQYGDTSDSKDTYEGPDSVCVDNFGNVIVTDKKQKRIDIISRKGSLKRTYRTGDVPKFVAVTHDKRLLVASSDGTVAFYEYL